MRNFKKQTGFHRILNSRPVLGLFFLFLIFFAWGVFRFFGKMNITLENKRNAENKLMDLQKQKDKLSASISDLKTENGVEENIREKFGLVKEGENVIIVVDDKNKIPTPETKTSTFFSSIRNWFK